MDTLTNNILINIFAQGSPKEIAKWQRVSSRWNSLIMDDFVWKEAFSAHWDQKMTANRICRTSWKDEYILRSNCIRNWSEKVSNTRSAVKFSWGKGEFLDASLDLHRWIFRIVSTEGLTSSYLKSGILSQKTILFFDKFFGIAPITFCGLIGYEGGKDATPTLAIGLANGEIILFLEKCPFRTLLENYVNIHVNELSSPIWKIIQPSPSTVLVIHKKLHEKSYDFVLWSLTEGNGNLNPTLLKHFFIAELKSFCFLNEAKTKVALLSSNNCNFIRIESFDPSSIDNTTTSNITSDQKISLPVSCDKCDLIISIPGSDWFIVVVNSDSNLLFFNHSTLKFHNSFRIPNHLTFGSIKSVYTCTSESNSAFNNALNPTNITFNLMIVNEVEDQVCHLCCTVSAINTREDDLRESKSNKRDDIRLEFDFEVKIESSFMSQIRGKILDISMGPVVSIILTEEGFFIFDSLNLNCINVRRIPTHYLKHLSYSSSSERVREKAAQIVRLEGDKLVILWGRNMAQIWNFGEDSSFLGNSSLKSRSNKNRARDGGFLGNKATRKYAQYAVNHGIQDWNDEVKEEGQLEHFRELINIPGLTEEELISYAKLLSNPNPIQEEGNFDSSYSFDDTDDDDDLKLALRLSITDK